jgi:hypothetical protein
MSRVDKLEKQQVAKLNKALKKLDVKAPDVVTIAAISAVLFQKHGNADRHGYIDWMHSEGFEAALREVFEVVAKKVEEDKCIRPIR